MAFNVVDFDRPSLSLIDRLRIAFRAAVEQAISNGKVARPIARKFVQFLLDQGVIHSD